MWRGCKTSNDRGFSNVAFLRTQIGLINHYFGKNEVSGIWITFPDPLLRQSDEKKRLTSPAFLRRYAEILRPNAVIRLKTDNPVLFDYTLELIRQDGHALICSTYDLYKSNLITDARDIQTHYEGIFRKMDIKIKYLEFSLNPLLYE
jgi:tRNA (guanine-N7-)-methyltransferase